MKNYEKNIKPEEKEKSAFNAAIAQLVRLHNIKQDIIDNRKEGKVQQWVTNLFCFREELCPCMSKEENVDCNKFEKTLSEIEPCQVGRKVNNIDVEKIKLYQRHLYRIEERLGLAHQSAEDEWADDEDW